MSENEMRYPPVDGLLIAETMDWLEAEPVGSDAPQSVHESIEYASTMTIVDLRSCIDGIMSDDGSVPSPDLDALTHPQLAGLAVGLARGNSIGRERCLAEVVRILQGM